MLHDEERRAGWRGTARNRDEQGSARAICMTVPVLIEERPDASGKVAPRFAGFRAAQGMTQPSSPQVLRSMALVLPRFFQDVDKAPAPSDSKVAPPARAPPRRSRSRQQRCPSLARLARCAVRDATPCAERKQARQRLLLVAATQPPARLPHARRDAARRRLRFVCFLSASLRRWRSAATRTRASRSSARRSSAAFSAVTASPLPPRPPVPPPPPPP